MGQVLTGRLSDSSRLALRDTGLGITRSCPQPRGFWSQPRVLHPQPRVFRNSAPRPSSRDRDVLDSLSSITLRYSSDALSLVSRSSSLILRACDVFAGQTSSQRFIIVSDRSLSVCCSRGLCDRGVRKGALCRLAARPFGVRKGRNPLCELSFRKREGTV
jgi:hypothetical protein